MDDKRQLFVENKTEVITLPELKRTVNAEDIGGLSRTRPVPHFKLIDDLNSILTEAGQAPVLDHMYIGRSQGTKLIKQIEQQHGVEKVLDAWLLDRLTGKIMLPSLSNKTTGAAIAFSYHDKGIDVAFGQDVQLLVFVDLASQHHACWNGDLPRINPLREIVLNWNVNLRLLEHLSLNGRDHVARGLLNLVHLDLNSVAVS